jgi:hypothetical protein
LAVINPKVLAVIVANPNQHRAVQKIVECCCLDPVEAPVFGYQQAFSDSPDHWPMLAIKVDAKRRLLRAIEVTRFSTLRIPDGMPLTSMVLKSQRRN